MTEHRMRAGSTRQPAPETTKSYSNFSTRNQVSGEHELCFPGQRNSLSGDGPAHWWRSQIPHRKAEKIQRGPDA